MSWGCHPYNTFAVSAAREILEKNPKIEIVIVSNKVDSSQWKSIENLRKFCVVSYNFMVTDQKIPLKDFLCKTLTVTKKPEDKIPEPEISGNWEILVAEDNLMNQKIILRILKSFGYHNITMV